MKKTLMMLAAAAATTSMMNVAVAAETQAAAAPGVIGTSGTGGGTTGPTTYAKSCNGTAGKSTVYGGSGNPVTTNALFIKTGFDIQCSNNVLLQWSEVSANAAAVASGSLKGNQSFNGHSNGGAIVAVKKCSGINDMCLDADVAGALDSAVSAAQAAAGSS